MKMCTGCPRKKCKDKVPSFDIDKGNCDMKDRTWSVPSHIPLTPLYVRRVAPNGAQQQEGREAALNTFDTVDLAWLSGRARFSSLCVMI